MTESQWKIFRELRVVALHRFCQRTLGEITRVAADDRLTQHERYLKVYELIHGRDQDLAAAFNDASRSKADFQLSLICAQGLVTQAELAQFGPDIGSRMRQLDGTALPYWKEQPAGVADGK